MNNVKEQMLRDAPPDRQQKKGISRFNKNKCNHQLYQGLPSVPRFP